MKKNTSDNNRDFDALILGAGAAGLAAARELSYSGLSAIVIEARERVGGRIWTVHDPNSALPIELGAEFVHGKTPETFGIINAARLLVDELPDVHFKSQSGKLSLISDFWGSVDEVRSDITKTMRRRSSGDLSIHEYLERGKLPADLRQLFINFVEGYHAARLEEISARSLAAGDEEAGGQSGHEQFRIVSGYDGVMKWLLGGLDPSKTAIRLNTVAAELRWKRGGVALHCTNRSGAVLEPFHARTALIALPHAVLQAKALRFNPPLKSKERAMEQLAVGQVFKIVFRFRSAFWEEDDFLRTRLQKQRSQSGGLTFMHSTEGSIPVWWTALPARVPLITGWAGGPQAEALLNDDEPGQVARSLAALAQVLAVPSRLLDELLERWWVHDWRADPFSRGAYVYVKVGGLAAQKTLGRPVAGTIFFAGEATDAEQTGTVAGAIASGRRAARELIRALKR